MPHKILLNIDLGELPNEPEELYAFAHIANIACSGHAGDEQSIKTAVNYCKKYGTLLSAHPSFPDRKNFGRTHINMSPHNLRTTITQQCDLLVDCLSSEFPVRFVKPHGALYHSANQNLHIAETLIQACVESLGYEVSIIGPPQGALHTAAQKAGLAFLREGFADRAQNPDGTLVPRSVPGSVIVDTQTALKKAKELSVTNTIDTLCVHGDNPCSLLIAQTVRAWLNTENPSC